MRRSDRLVIAFGAAAAVMLALSLLLVFFFGRSTALMPADSPGGTVQRFLVALQQKDLTGAAKFLSPSFNSLNVPKSVSGVPVPDLSSASYYADNSWKATLRSISVTGDAASVAVAFDISMSAQPFGSQVYQSYVNYNLMRQGTLWLITAEGFSIPGLSPPVAPSLAP